YEVAEGHALRIALAPTASTGQGKNERHDPDERDPLEARRDMLVHVAGIEYEADLFGGRLENIAFAKSYLQLVRSEAIDTGRLLDRDGHWFGLGDGLRYRFHEHVQAKLSWEWATRLPRPDEVFGDGALVDPNLALEPETSHNLNLGASF